MPITTLQYIHILVYIWPICTPAEDTMEENILTVWAFTSNHAFAYFYRIRPDFIKGFYQART